MVSHGFGHALFEQSSLNREAMGPDSMTTVDAGGQKMLWMSWLDQNATPSCPTLVTGNFNE